jgi:hypothetical protein
MSVFPASKQFQIFCDLRLSILFGKTIQPGKKKQVLPRSKLLVQARRFRQEADPVPQVIQVAIQRTTCHDSGSGTGRQ